MSALPRAPPFNLRNGSLRDSTPLQTARGRSLIPSIGRPRTTYPKPTGCRIIDCYYFGDRVIHHHPGFQQAPSSPLGGLLLSQSKEARR